jgi:uncharacterized protein YfkK (UPF0435 family)
MQYTLILPNGKIMQFYIQEIAELYQSINGGVVVTNEVLEESYESFTNVLV